MDTADLPFEVWAATSEARAVIAMALAYRDRPVDPDAPFIASRSIPHDGTRRVLAVGRTKGGSTLLQVPAPVPHVSTSHSYHQSSSIQKSTRGVMPAPKLET